MFYLFHGEDEFSRSETVADFKKKMGDPGLAELNITVFDGRKVALGELQHACDSVPFMADRRLVIVEGLLARLESRGQKERLERLTQYLKLLPETTRLVFVENKPIGKSNPVHRLALADERGHVKEFKPPQKTKAEPLDRAASEEEGGTNQCHSHRNAGCLRGQRPAAAGPGDREAGHLRGRGASHQPRTTFACWSAMSRRPTSSRW